MVFKNILVPYDGSDYSNLAFKTALEFAKKHESNLIIVTCLDIPDVGGWYIDNRINRDIMKKVKNHTKLLFNNLETVAKKNSIQLKCYALETDKTVKTLISFSNSKKIDLIIMGSSGRGKFDKLFLGSISNSVLQQAKCPVLIIK